LLDTDYRAYYRVCIHLKEGLRIGFRATIAEDGPKNLEFRVIVEKAET